MKHMSKLIALIVALLMMSAAVTAFAGTYVSDPVKPVIARPGEEPAVQPEEAETARQPEEAGAQQGEGEQPAEPEAVVQTQSQDGSVNIRAAAGADSEVIGKLADSARVLVLGTQGNWTKIRAGDIVGYVYSKYLQIDAPAEALEEPSGEELAEQELGEALPAEQKIVIAADRDVRDLKPGDVLTLSAQLIGFEELDYSLNWQVRRDGGSWEDIGGATGTSLTVNIAEQHNGYSWRLEAKLSGTD